MPGEETPQLDCKSEKLIRALYEPYWEPTQKRPSTCAFTQSDVSVSRPAILPREEIVAIFKHNIRNKIEATVTVDAAAVLEICAASEARIFVDACADPTKDVAGNLDDPSHALIRGRADAIGGRVPKKLTKGIATEILKRFKHDLVE